MLFNIERPAANFSIPTIWILPTTKIVHGTYYYTANSGITINIQHIIQAFNQKLIA
jgi:hypothetical protein